MENNKQYFLCSSSVIRAFPEVEHSKPFKSGYKFDEDDEYYVALLEFEEVQQFYNLVIKPQTEPINFWCRECVSGTMDTSSLFISGMRRNGIFSEIENITGLTTEKNQAMVIYELARRYKCTPIELINKIVK